MKPWPYEDIVNLPHHESDKHPRMEMEKRAAQFAPFMALTGYNDAVAETERLTDDDMELDDNALEELNRTLQEIMMENTRALITWFVPDKRKSGGSFKETAGLIRRIEMGILILDDGMRIPLEQIRMIRRDTLHEK